MQGPYPPDPSGQNREHSASSGRQIKDWQKNTWFGPVPFDANPFDEADEAPELAELRSENVNRKSGDFWKEQLPTGYVPRVNEKQKGNLTREGQGKKIHRPRNISLRTMLLLLAVPLAIILVLYFAVFRVRKIEVRGNADISAQDIIRFSGISYGDSIFSLNEEEVERRIHSQAAAAARDPKNPDVRLYRLQFAYLETELPGSVTIAVKEREYCSWMTANGLLFVMDKTGMILFESEQIEKYAYVTSDGTVKYTIPYPQVKGMAIRSGLQAGQTIGFTFSWQEEIYRELFLEIKVTGCAEEIQEVDLSNAGSILMVTRDGYTVSLGDGSNLHAKLHSMLLVRQQLKEMGKSSGTINVAEAETPSWTPPLS